MFLTAIPWIGNTFALASVITQAIAQGSHGNSQTLGRVGPIPVETSQRFENEFSLNPRQRVPNQLFDACPVDRREHRQRWCTDERPVWRLVGFVAWHQHLHNSGACPQFPRTGCLDMLKIPLTPEGASRPALGAQQHQRRAQRNRGCPWLADDRDAGNFSPTNRLKIYICYDFFRFLRGLPYVGNLVPGSVPKIISAPTAA